MTQPCSYCGKEISIWTGTCPACHHLWPHGLLNLAPLRAAAERLGLLGLLPRTEGARNRETFRRQLLAAVADGRLTQTEIRRLNALRLRLHYSEQDIASFAGQAYAEAFRAVTADGELTQAEEDELRQIQLYLLVPDHELGANKKELERLRLLREIYEGRLPTKTVTGLILQTGEVAYWKEPASLMEERVVRREYVGGSHGISLRIAKGLSYRVGSYRGHLISKSDVVPVSGGDLIITNKRLIFRGDPKGFNFALDKLLDVSLFGNGLRVSGSNAKPYTLQFSGSGDVDMIGAILSHAINNFASR